MANFTPPTGELSSVTASPLQSTNKFANFVFGNPTVIEGTRKINHTCLQLNGTTDYLVVTEPMLSKNVFTVDLWIWFNAISNSEQCIVSQASGSGAGATSLSVKNQKLAVVNNSLEIGGVTTLIAKTWNHIAFVRNGSSIKAYLNGYLEASYDSFVDPDRTMTQVGARLGSNLLFGRLDAVRFRSEESWSSTFTPPDRSTYIGDEYFDDVVLLIRGDSFTAPTDPYADEVALQLGMDHYTNSTYMGPWDDTDNVFLQFVGNAKIVSGHFKHNFPSIAFDGINDAIVVTNSSNITLGTTFTFEFWTYIPSYAVKRTLFDKRESTALSGMLIYIDTDTKIYAKFGDSTSGWDVELASGTLSIGWHHVVIVRNASDSNSWKLFVDGSQSGATLNSAITIAENANLVIGRNRDSAEYFNGLLSEIQLTQSAKYTTSVTVPTEPVPDPINVEYDQTSLLLHFDGADGVTEFVDSSRWNHTVVGSFGAKISTTQSKFGSSSLYLNGTTGCGVIVQPHEACNLGEGDFTIECWARVDAIGTARPLLNLWVQGGVAWAPFFTLQMNSSNRFIFYWMPYSDSTAMLTGSVVTIAANTWYHIALTRCRDWWTLWVNGAIDAQATANPRNFNSSIKFRSERWKTYGVTMGDYFDGTKYGTTTTEWAGYIDEVRIVKGKAMFREPFTPPTAAYSLSSNYPYRDTNVKLFLDLTSDYYIKDKSSGYNVISLEGSITAGKAIGGSYASFDGNGDAIRITTAGDVAFATEDYTVEAWVYPITGGRGAAQNYNRIFETELVGTGGGIVMAMNNAGTTNPCGVYLADTYSGTVGWGIDTIETIPNSTWSHVAFTKEGYYLNAWVNGVLKSKVLLDGIMSKALSHYSYTFTNFLKTAAAAPSSSWSTAVSQEAFNSQSSTGVYFEVLITAGATSNNHMVGVVTTAFDATSDGVYPGFRATGWSYNGANGQKYNAGSGTTYGSTFTTGDVIGVAVKNGKVWFAKNGTWQASGNPVTEANPAYSNLTGNVRIGIGIYTSATLTVRGRLQEFSYSVPSGFVPFNAVASFAVPILEKTKVSIGANNSAGESFYGYIDDLRLTRSIVRYTMTWAEKALSGDANAASVTLLLNCNGTDGGTTFTDSSNSNKTVTPTNTTTVTGTKKFGTASALFNGTSSYLTLVDHSDWNYGSGNFTIEMWYKFSSVPADVYTASGAQCLLNQRFDANNMIALIASKTGFTFSTWDGGSQTVLLSVTVTHDYDWHHVAVTRSTNTFTIWVDGLSKGTTSASVTLPDLSAPLELGRASGGDRYFAGWLDDVRLTKGVCRYPSEFVFPQTPQGLVPIPKRKLYDLPSNTAAPYSIRTLRGASAKFDIAADLVYPGTTATESAAYWTVMAYNYAMISGTTNFTIEGWFNPAVSAARWVFTRDVNQSDSFILGVSKSILYFRHYTTDLTVGSLSLTGWNHIVFQRKGDYKQIYLNGVKVGEISMGNQDFSNRTYTLNLGATPAVSTGSRYIGYIDGFRFTRGVARYSDNFTPPTTQFSPKFNSFSNTDLMLFFTDSKTYPYNVRVIGSPKTVRPSGVTEKGACWFNGDGDFIQLSNASSLVDEDFTLEFWFESAQQGGSDPIYLWTQGLTLTQTDRVGIAFVEDSIKWFRGTTYVTLDKLYLYTWTHIAITRSSGWVRMFVNRRS